MFVSNETLGRAAATAVINKKRERSKGRGNDRLRRDEPSGAVRVRYTTVLFAVPRTSVPFYRTYLLLHVVLFQVNQSYVRVCHVCGW